MPYKIIDIIIVRGLQQLNIYNKLNPVEIKIGRNKIDSDLAKYQKFKCRFLVDGLLFSSTIVNDTSRIFITTNDLNDAKKLFT